MNEPQHDPLPASPEPNAPAEASPQDTRAPGEPAPTQGGPAAAPRAAAADGRTQWLRIVAVAFILLLGGWVAFQPSLVYASTPRIVLFFLLALAPASLLSDTLTARFQLRLGWFAAAAGGSTAVFFIALYFLDAQVKPETKMSTYSFFSSDVAPLEVHTVTRLGATRTFMGEEGTSVAVIFPENSFEANIIINSPLGEHKCKLTYKGTRDFQILLKRGKTCLVKPL